MSLKSRNGLTYGNPPYSIFGLFFTAATELAIYVLEIRASPQQVLRAWLEFPSYHHFVSISIMCNPLKRAFEAPPKSNDLSGVLPKHFCAQGCSKLELVDISIFKKIIAADVTNFNALVNFPPKSSKRNNKCVVRHFSIS